jgi:hypothetical protein
MNSGTAAVIALGSVLLAVAQAGAATSNTGPYSPPTYQPKVERPEPPKTYAPKVEQPQPPTYSSPTYSNKR